MEKWDELEMLMQGLGAPRPHVPSNREEMQVGLESQNVLNLILVTHIFGSPQREF